VLWVQVDVALRTDLPERHQVIGVVEDITGRRAAEQGLADSHARFEIALRHAPVTLYTHDAALRYTWIYNSPLRPAEWFIGRTDEELFPPESSQALTALKRRALETGRGERAELRLTLDDLEVWHDLLVEPILDGRDRVTGLTCAAVNVSERRRAERERDRLLESERAAREEAERAGRLKDEFLATLSHELRTPLNAMLGWAQILQQRTTDPQLTRGLEVIERNVRVQTQLIDDLLDMSRILSGKIGLALEPVELVPVVEAALDTLRPSAELNGVTVSFSGAGGSGVVRADQNRLQQIVWNLLSNAIKFTPAGGRVDVRIDAAPGERRIAVIDTGCGIAPQFLPHVFERFRQADASSTRRHTGLGLGLAITRHLVEMHGGRIAAHSDGAGHGATFVVTLPVIEAVANRGASRSARRERAPGAPPLEGVRALVVDDDPDARELAMHVLTDAGASVRTADSVRTALEAFDGRVPDVLVSDISMPLADGYELIRRVRASGGSRARVPAIALTAFARDDDRDRVRSAGYDAHLAKPVDSRTLVATIASLVRGARVREEGGRD
jgi:signal transduction histidine kinase/CheY-like chemotaxis protein